MFKVLRDKDSEICRPCDAAYPTQGSQVSNNKIIDNYMNITIQIINNHMNITIQIIDNYMNITTQIINNHMDTTIVCIYSIDNYMNITIQNNRQ